MSRGIELDKKGMDFMLFNTLLMSNKLKQDMTKEEVDKLMQEARKGLAKVIEK